MQEKAKKKKQYSQPQPKTCMFCGSKNIEQTVIKHVGVLKICKDCREEQ